MRFKKVIKLLHILLFTTLVTAGFMMLRAIKVLVTLLFSEGNM